MIKQCDKQRPVRSSNSVFLTISMMRTKLNRRIRQEWCTRWTLTPKFRVNKHWRAMAIWRAWRKRWTRTSLSRIKTSTTKIWRSCQVLSARSSSQTRDHRNTVHRIRALKRQWQLMKTRYRCRRKDFINTVSWAKAQTLWQGMPSYTERLRWT